MLLLCVLGGYKKRMMLWVLVGFGYFFLYLCVWFIVLLVMLIMMLFVRFKVLVSLVFKLYFVKGI